MIDLLSFKKLVIRYLEFLITEDFKKFYDLSFEIIFTENIVSKKVIVVSNFSEQIIKDGDLKIYLETVITNINLRLIREEDMYRAVKDY